jgi:hypothetical protein
LCKKFLYERLDQIGAMINKMIVHAGDWCFPVSGRP